MKFLEKTLKRVCCGAEGPQGRMLLLKLHPGPRDVLELSEGINGEVYSITLSELYEALRLRHIANVGATRSHTMQN